MSEFIAQVRDQVNIFNVVRKLPDPSAPDATHMSIITGNVHMVFVNFNNMPVQSFFRGKSAISVILDGISHEEFQARYPNHAATLRNCLVSLQGNFVAIAEKEHV